MADVPSYEYLRFFRGERGTLKGDVSIFHLIHMASDRELEAGHDYIQWVFPNETLSRIRPDAVHAPITQAEIRAINEDHVARKNAQRMVIRMLHFWGLKYTPDGPVVQDEAAFSRSVGRAGDHNQLRMTRMLSFFRSMGWTKVVDLTKACLKKSVHTRQKKAHGFWDAV